MELVTKTLLDFKNIYLSLLLFPLSSLVSAETVDGYTFKGHVRVSLNTIEFGNSSAENGLYVNARDSISLALEHQRRDILFNADGGKKAHAKHAKKQGLVRTI